MIYAAKKEAKKKAVLGIGKWNPGGDSGGNLAGETGIGNPGGFMAGARLGKYGRLQGQDAGRNGLGPQWRTAPACFRGRRMAVAWGSESRMYC